jgi:hypothetical protein
MRLEAEGGAPGRFDDVRSFFGKMLLFIIFDE